jgi:hypothetical protein
VYNEKRAVSPGYLPRLKLNLHSAEEGVKEMLASPRPVAPPGSAGFQPAQPRSGDLSLAQPFKAGSGGGNNARVA